MGILIVGRALDTRVVVGTLSLVLNEKGYSRHFPVAEKVVYS